MDCSENKTLIVGGGGVGKSHLLAVCLKREPPLFRVSTPCAEIPPYIMENIQVYEGGFFEILSSDKYIRMVMKSVKD